MNHEAPIAILKDLYRKTTGVCVITKSGWVGCPLGDLVAKSGIQRVLPQLDLTINNIDYDYQKIVTGGNTAGLLLKDSDLGANVAESPFIHRTQNGILYMDLATYATDNYSRPVNLRVGIKGTLLTDKTIAFHFFINLFPNLRFQAFADQPNDTIIDTQASQNTILHPPLKAQ